jgi:hypothetical protein
MPKINQYPISRQKFWVRQEIGDQCSKSNVESLSEVVDLQSRVSVLATNDLIDDCELSI